MPPRAVQKLIKNGNSFQVTVARPLLNYLDWPPGCILWCVVTEEKELVVRPMRPGDIPTVGMRPMVHYDLKGATP